MWLWLPKKGPPHYPCPVQPLSPALPSPAEGLTRGGTAPEQGGARPQAGVEALVHVREEGLAVPVYSQPRTGSRGLGRTMASHCTLQNLWGCSTPFFLPF